MDPKLAVVQDENEGSGSSGGSASSFFSCVSRLDTTFDEDDVSVFGGEGEGKELGGGESVVVGSGGGDDDGKVEEAAVGGNVEGLVGLGEGAYGGGGEGVGEVLAVGGAANELLGAVGGQEVDIAPGQGVGSDEEEILDQLDALRLGRRERQGQAPRGNRPAIRLPRPAAVVAPVPRPAAVPPPQPPEDAEDLARAQQALAAFLGTNFGPRRHMELRCRFPNCTGRRAAIGKNLRGIRLCRRHRDQFQSLLDAAGAPYFDGE